MWSFVGFRSLNKLINFELPEKEQLFIKLLTSNDVYQSARINEQGKLLNALFELFNNFDLKEIFFDKFWFTFIKSLASNDKIEGNTFCFDELFQKCHSEIKESEYTFEESKDGLTNLRKGLLNILNWLIAREIFQLGYRLRCKKCYSKWYG